jgi:hypothetical protein
MPKLTWFERAKRSTAATQANIVCTMIVAGATWETRGRRDFGAAVRKFV